MARFKGFVATLKVGVKQVSKNKLVNVAFEGAVCEHIK